MKKLLCVILSLSLCLIAAAACTPDTPATTEEPVTTETEAPVTSEPVTEPETTEPATEPETTEPATEPETTEPETTEQTTAAPTVAPTTAVTTKQTTKQTTKSPYSENAIEYYGRFVKSANGMRFDWSGSSIVAGFEGTGVELQINLIKGNTDYFNIYIDNGEPTVLKVDNKNDYYMLAEGLKKGYHTVRVEKRTEGGQGALCEFVGFSVKGGKLTKAPARKQMTIEVVGDSITAAYGNMAAGAWSGFKLEEENFGESYGKILADLLDADVTVLGWSGGGMFQDLGGNRGAVFSNNLYWRNLAHEDKQDFVPAFEPDIMIINLGTNDFQSNVTKKTDDFEDGFLDAYEEFIRTIRKSYKNTHIVMCIGPINTLAYDSLVIIKDELTGEGYKNLSVLPLVLMDTPSTERWGADGHPSAASHNEMAYMLYDHLVETLNL